MQPCQASGSGSDGGRYRVRYTPGLGPGYQPCVVRTDRTPPRRRADAALRRVTEKLVPGGGIPASLRARGRQLGVSHEAVRQAMIAVGVPTGLDARNRAIRAMASAGLPWPAIAQAFGMSPAGIRYVCRDLPPRKAGRPWHGTRNEKGTTLDQD